MASLEDEFFGEGSSWVPSGARDWIVSHPKVILLAAGMLIAWHLYEAYEVTALMIRVKDAISTADQAASEALGG
jgi:hypothetical protein